MTVHEQTNAKQDKALDKKDEARVAVDEFQPDKTVGPAYDFKTIMRNMEAAAKERNRLVDKMFAQKAERDRQEHLPHQSKLVTQERLANRSKAESEESESEES